jgi:glycogen debranching enzyme
MSNLKFHLPRLNTNHKPTDRAFRLALGDLCSNTVYFQDGLLEKPEPVFLAGLDYSTPWTRDAAINVWNGGGLLFPEAAKATLLSVLTKQSNGRIVVSGQYWDAIIWVCGAWAYYLYNGDRDFLRLALDVTDNSLRMFEAAEFDSALGLFRGAACYGDGVAAYPDIYAQTEGKSAILAWPAANPDKVAKPGYGLPMMALSTNCLYLQAYELADLMAVELGRLPDPTWNGKATALRQAIQKHFWMPNAERFRYLTDPFGGCDHQEGLGHAFALLFGLTDERQTASVFRQQYVSEWGIPCVWPTFARYQTKGAAHFGRHSGTVWPHIQGFWAHAAARYGQILVFQKELEKLTKAANRYGQFLEIYHPFTGEPYGGEQEGRKTPTPWKSCERQTWSATAYLRMVLMGLFGMDFSPSGVCFQPTVPAVYQKLELQGFSWRQTVLHIAIEGNGNSLVEFQLDGQKLDQAFLPVNLKGERRVSLKLG